MVNDEDTGQDHLRPLYGADGEPTIPVNDVAHGFWAELRQKRWELQQERASLDSLTYEAYRRSLGGRSPSPELERSYQHHRRTLEGRVAKLLARITALTNLLTSRGLDPGQEEDGP